MERPDALFWNLPLESLQSGLEANQTGLSRQDARARRAKFGPNPFKSRPSIALICTRLIRHLLNTRLVVA